MTDQAFRIDWRARTDRGSVREHNEDRYIAVPEARVWVVADGMGGHDHGDWASERIVAAVEGIAPEHDFDGMLKATADAVHSANAEIFSAAQANGGRMGSTVVGLVISDRRFAVLWAGDSRAYLLRDQMLIQLTRDHTQVQALIDRGLLSPEEAQSHPMSHVLAKAVGVEPALEIDAIADTVESATCSSCAATVSMGRWAKWKSGTYCAAARPPKPPSDWCRAVWKSARATM